MANQIKAPINYPIIAGGKIVAGGSILFGQPNVKPDEDNPSTLKAVYLDAALTQQAENPQGISSDGVFDQSDTGILYGLNDTVYSIVIRGANKKELSYIPEYDLSDANAAQTAQDAAAAAASSESNAIAAKDLTEALYTDFTNRYFGAYSSDPAVDDNGNPPNEGSIYWNTTLSVFKVWTSGAWEISQIITDLNDGLVTATGTTTARTLSDRSSDWVNVLDFKSLVESNSTTSSDWTNAIQAALDTGKRVIFPPLMDFDVTDELEITTDGQIITFLNTGGYAYGEDVGLNWSPNTRIVAKGTFSKKARTRIKYRSSDSDPDDDPLSVVINIQAEGVILENPCIWLNCDYTDTSPSNLGDDVDVGIFIGTRVGTQIHNPQVIGYFRKTGIHIDVTGQTGLPRFNDKNGNPFPTGSVQNGCDGTHIYNPYIRGARRGLGLIGAQPKTGETGYSSDYYDGLSNTTVPDARGSFGASDSLVIGGRIYGPDHHSNRRLLDPSNWQGALNETTLENESDDASAALYISGLAGNSSGNIWGMRFVGTRIATFEMFRVRLDHASRINFMSCHIEGRNGGRFDTLGNSIDTNDYTETTYGYIAGTSNTDRIIWTDSNEPNGNNAFIHFYGGSHYLLDANGRIFTSSYIQSFNELDLRTGYGENVKFRQDDSTIAELNDVRLLLSLAQYISSTDELDLRSAVGELIRMRIGSTTAMTVSDTAILPELGQSIGSSGSRAGAIYSDTYYAGTSSLQGESGTFVDQSGNTVTVTNGIITDFGI